jgi:hypothetical protein
MKAIAKLSINLAWRVPVETTEGHTVIELHTAVGDINAFSLVAYQLQQQS